jgi:hypothetical protein
MKNAVYLLLVLVGLFVSLVALSIGRFFNGIAVCLMAGVNRVRSWMRQ